MSCCAVGLGDIACGMEVWLFVILSCGLEDRGRGLGVWDKTVILLSGGLTAGSESWR